MAFSKIAGLDVMPRKPSLAIIFFRSPFRRIFRRIKSSHGDCPYANRLFSGFPPCTAFTLGIVVVVVIIFLLKFQSGRVQALLYAREVRAVLHKHESRLLESLKERAFAPAQLSSPSAACAAPHS